MKRISKKLKRKNQHKDFKKKNRILKNWKREQKNKREMGEDQSLMPVQFKKLKKFNKVKK